MTSFSKKQWNAIVAALGLKSPTHRLKKACAARTVKRLRHGVYTYTGR